MLYRKNEVEAVLVAFSAGQYRFTVVLGDGESQTYSYVDGHIVDNYGTKRWRMRRLSKQALARFCACSAKAVRSDAPGLKERLQETLNPMGYLGHGGK